MRQSRNPMDEYDAIAEWFARERSPIVGLPEIETLARALPSGARVLDAGCGTGFPILQYLLQKGFQLFAIDSSERMVALFRERFPHVPVEQGSIQASALFASTFDAVIAWGVLFHLSPDEQRAAIANVAPHLAPGGWFLFTSAKEPEETSGEMNGVTFRYRSLGSPEYRRALDANGMELVDEHEDKWQNYVYVARQR
ncbi:MAG TPA: class I SAM-dependent methyltransferase [Thermoanaerobaculia bacterium]